MPVTTPPAPCSQCAISSRKQNYLHEWGHVIPDEEHNGVCGVLAPLPPNDLWNGLFYVVPQLCHENPRKSLSKAAIEIWDESIAFINERRDCSDFAIHAVLRILNLAGDSCLVGRERNDDLRRVLRHFVYWRDEKEHHPGHQLTENHQIMFHAAELLAGELLLCEYFPSAGILGDEHAVRGKERVLRWIDWRMRFGFSEWLSQHYLEENLVPLLNLHQFSQDEEIRSKVEALLNVMVFEMATNSFCGTYSATQGRVYEDAILNPDLSVTSPVRYILWGTGAIARRLSMSAICLATSHYEPPGLITKIAFDRQAEMENRQRSSLTYSEAIDFGIDPALEENHPLFVSLGYQYWPDYMRHSVRFLHPERWEGRDVRSYLEDPGLQPSGELLPESPYVYPRVHPYSFRTPDFLLSCANDWLKGHRGYQHHVWQATLPGKAAVFTTCPNDIPRTGRWAGNAYLPRAMAFRNVLLCIYQPPECAWHANQLGPFLESHAWFPTFLFDEVIECNGWILGRNEGAFVGLRSLAAGHWSEPDQSFLENVGYGAYRNERYDFISSSSTVWACELGNSFLHGNFSNFVESISQARFYGSTTSVCYDSPSLGRIEFGWDKPFLLNGNPVESSHEQRFSNSYCHADFNSGRYVIRYQGEPELVLR